MKIWIDDLRPAPKGYRWIKIEKYLEDFTDD